MIRNLSSRISRVPYPPISAVRDLLARYGGSPLPLLDLCQAVPDYPPADELRAYLARAVEDDMTGRYTPDEGLHEVRESVARWYQRHYGGGPEPDELLLTVGASQAFWLAMNVLCNEGDDVIVPLPAYFDHPMGLVSMGVTPRFVPYMEGGSGFPTPERLEGFMTPKTKALLLVSPNNPSGEIISAELLEELFVFCRSQAITLIVDETYNAFLPHVDGPHRLFQRDDWTEHFIHLASFGKTFALTGYRPGALVASRELLYQAVKIQDSMVVCQPRITQLALHFACDHLDDWSAQRNVELQQRQNLFREALEASSSTFQLLSSGSFFAWVRHPFEHSSGEEVVEKLIAEKHLACLPGGAFGPGLDRFLRLAIGNLSLADIPPAIERLTSCPSP